MRTHNMVIQNKFDLWKQPTGVAKNLSVYQIKAIVKTQRNSTQLNPTLKQLALELDIVVTCSTTSPPQTFQQLLDQLES